MNYWLRLYTSILNDPKVQLLPDRHFKHWVNLLCIAKENDGALPEIGDIAFRLRMSDAEAENLLVDLRARGLLDEDGETLKPHNWDERQYKSDTPGESSKQYRERLAGGNGTERNYIYFIGTTLDRIVKIGISKNPWARLVEFQTGSPETLSVLATFRTDSRSEMEIHNLLDGYRQHGEWFLLPEHIHKVVSVAAASKQNYGQLVELLRQVLRSKSTKLRSEATTDNYAATTESEESTEADTDSETEPEQSRAETEASSASRGKPRSARAPVLPDEEWLDKMQQNPAYSMLNVRMLYHRMLAWCEERGKTPSRRRLINWMNNEDKPMTAKSSPPKGNGYVGASPKPALVAQPPDNNAYMSKCVEDLIADEDLLLGGQIYDEIIQRGGAKLEWEIRLVAWYELHKDEPATPEQVAQINASIQLLANKR